MKSFSEFLKEYDQRPEFSSQRTLSSLDFYKHDFLYSKTVCEKLLSEQLVYTPKTQYSIGDFHQDKLQSLLERLNQQDQTLLVSDFNDCFKVHDVQHRWTRLIKETARNPNSPSETFMTAAGELGVLMYIDAYLDNGSINETSLVDNGYWPSNRIKRRVDSSQIAQYIKWLNQDNNLSTQWNQSCIDNAKLIIDYVGVNQLKKLELHFRSTLVSKLESIGKQLTEYDHAAKWNPSDVWIVQPGTDVADVEYCTLETFNRRISSMKDVVGISLKENGKARKGSTSISAITELDEQGRFADVEFTTKKNDHYNQMIKQLILKLRDKAKNLKLVFDGDIYNNLDNYIDRLKPGRSSTYYRNVLITLYQFNLMPNLKTFAPLLQQCFLKAIGRGSKSPTFLLSNGKTIRRLSPSDEPWEYVRTEFNLLSPSIKVYINYEGEQYKCVIRMKQATSKMPVLECK